MKVMKTSLGIGFFALMVILFVFNEATQLNPAADLTLSASDDYGAMATPDGSEYIELRTAAVSPNISIIDDFAQDALARTFAMNGGGALCAGTSQRIRTPLALIATFEPPAPARAPPLISFY